MWKFKVNWKMVALHFSKAIVGDFTNMVKCEKQQVNWENTGKDVKELTLRSSLLKSLKCVK